MASERPRQPGGDGCLMAIYELVVLAGYLLAVVAIILLAAWAVGARLGA